MPVFIMDSGPMIQIVHLVDYARNDRAADIEKQAQADFHLLRSSPGSLQRFEFFLVVALMSACLTFLTVSVLSALRMDHYLAG